LEKDKLRPDVKHKEDEASRRLFVLQIVQPGLAGLMDGSVSTLAPVFAAAFATHNSWGCIRGRAGGIHRGRHQHGLRRGPVRRRQPHRRSSLGVGIHLRSHDCSWRDRPHAPIPNPRFQGGDGCRHASRGDRTGYHNLGSGIAIWRRRRSRQLCKSDWAESWFSLQAF
jgi:hypothetical protein